MGFWALCQEEPIEAINEGGLRGGVSEGGRGKLLARSSHTVAAPDSLGGLVKNLVLAPLPEFLTQEVWGEPSYFPSLLWLWVLNIL